MIFQPGERCFKRLPGLLLSGYDEAIIREGERYGLVSFFGNYCCLVRSEPLDFATDGNSDMNIRQL